MRLWRQLKAEKLEIQRVQSCDQLRDREPVLLDVKQQVAAFAGRVEVATAKHPLETTTMRHDRGTRCAHAENARDRGGV